MTRFIGAIVTGQRLFYNTDSKNMETNHSIPILPPRPQHVRIIEGLGAASADGPLPLLKFNEMLYNEGIISIEVDKSGKPSQVICDATVDQYIDRHGIPSNGPFTFVLQADIVKKTVTWRSNIPDFPSQSQKPYQIGYLRTYNFFHTGEHEVDFGEICFILDCMAGTLKPINLQDKERIIEALEERNY